MTDQTKPLSPRHERFVLEFLRDGNATQAYIRAGYAPRSAQPSASRLLRDPRIAAAVADGRERLAEALTVDVTRLAQEYAKIAFANVDDFVCVGEDGRLRIDLDKAGQAQRAGIVELRIASNRNQEQAVTLKLGKLQALAALTRHVELFTKRPEPGLTPEDRQRFEAKIVEHESDWQHALNDLRRLAHERDEAQIALAKAEAKLRVLGSAAPPQEPQKPITKDAAPPEPVPEQAPQAKPAVEPGMPTEPPPEWTPGHLHGRMFWNTDRRPPPGPTYNEVIQKAGKGGFPGQP